MIKSSYNIIGVMSGTSLDGIDLAYISFEFNKTWSFKIFKSETISYSENWIDKLSNLTYLTNDELKGIDLDYTIFLAEVIIRFIDKHKIDNIDAICSHGHTALHQPEKGYTYQIGNKRELATLTSHKVVCDFRVQDVAFGGQGAPLVPIGDKLLFSEFDICINLGGFANISLEKDNERVAFDICPVNIVLNHYCKSIGAQYDLDGITASKGKVNTSLLNELNLLEFYEKKFPKSLGLEWVNANVIPLVDDYNLSTEDILRTLVEHIAVQISYVLLEKPESTVLLSGGGVYNLFLLERLKTICDHNIVIPSKDIIEYKEALIFGFLGVLRLRGEINCLASVTGASHNHSSGIIHLV